MAAEQLAFMLGLVIAGAIGVGIALLVYELDSLRSRLSALEKKEPSDGR